MSWLFIHIVSVWESWPGHVDFFLWLSFRCENVVCLRLDQCKRFVAGAWPGKAGEWAIWWNQANMVPKAWIWNWPVSVEMTMVERKLGHERCISPVKSSSQTKQFERPWVWRKKQVSLRMAKGRNNLPGKGSSQSWLLGCGYGESHRRGFGNLGKERLDLPSKGDS